MLLAGCGNGGDTGPTPGDTPTATAEDAVTLTIQNFAYEPADLEVSPGQEVTVINRDTVAHTVTSTEDGEFDTGSIASGESGTFTAPSETGSHPYTCSLHPNMRGTLTVR
ncbi:cupredoxin domain-containing protein [Streptomyces durbertensis]|uniref:Cupredoxin domain-containing protein n=2 Tax=Streptomyces durbertensis TaxID=2448886 RepID=A0ABR6EIZ8_9ACTN|nr:cupredoxin domain-containing protein [Streptomyces durbertensis]